MNPFDGLIGRWVRVTLKPDDAAAAIAASSRPVCYVLDHESSADLAVLNSVCAEHNLPRPERRLLIGGRRADRAFYIRLAGAIRQNERALERLKS